MKPTTLPGSKVAPAAFLRAEVVRLEEALEFKAALDAHAIVAMGMRERAQACGGTAVFIGQPDRGTTVRVTIPGDHEEERSRWAAAR